MSGFSHLDDSGAVRMVDVGAKPMTRRTARASGRVHMQPATLAAITKGEMAKGNVLETARIAGIMAAKRTAELIPLCHTLPLDSVTIDLRPTSEGALSIEATAATTGRTGVEMEALAAVSVAALTVYDMCKSVDRAMTIVQIQLEEKTGGARGDFVRNAIKSDGSGSGA